MAEIFIPSSPLTALRSSSSFAVFRLDSPLTSLSSSLSARIDPVEDAAGCPPPNNQPEHHPDNTPGADRNYRESTPGVNSQQAFADCSASPPLPADKLYLVLDEEMRQSFIGPLPVETFLNDFLPAEAVPPPLFSPGFEEVANATCETDMYAPFVRPLNFSYPALSLQQIVQVDTINEILTRFTGFDTSNTPSSEAGAEYRPDVTIYEKKKLSPTRTLTSFQKMEMFVEFKHGSSADPFATEDGSFPKLFSTTCAIRGQLVLYATRQQAYQFRTSIISVGIFGKIARFFRWDRTGCLVTEPIDYSSLEGNELLTEFFHRLDRLADDPESRGWDPTVEDPTPREVKLLDKAISEACKKRQVKPPPQPTYRMKTRSQKRVSFREPTKKPKSDPMFSQLIESVGDHSKYPRRKVSVFDGNVQKSYIVGRATSIPKSPTGRATRGFVACSLETGKLVFLKDSWRPDIRCIKPEDCWYQRLRAKRGLGKNHIGEYSHGSDVYAVKKLIKCPDKKQQTITHLYAKEHGRVEALMGYAHHRVVQTQLYLPLEMFRNSRHLVRVMYDVAKGAFPSVFR